MSYQDMSKDQLINQLEILRERIEELERKDAERRREEIALRNMTFVDELTGSLQSQRIEKPCYPAIETCRESDATNGFALSRFR